MVGPERLLLNSQRPQQHRLSLGGTPEIIEQRPLVVEQRGEARVLAAKRFFEDPHGAREQRLGLAKAALRLVEHGQVAQAQRVVRVLAAERSLADRERAQEMLL